MNLHDAATAILSYSLQSGLLLVIGLQNGVVNIPAGLSWLIVCTIATSLEKIGIKCQIPGGLKIHPPVKGPCGRNDC